MKKVRKYIIPGIVLAVIIGIVIEFIRREEGKGKIALPEDEDQWNSEMDDEYDDWNEEMYGEWEDA